MNSSKNLFRLIQIAVRGTRNASTGVPSSRFQAVKAAQKIFGVDDGVPVHLKAGFRDQALVMLTWGLITVGTVGAGHTVYKLLHK